MIWVTRSISLALSLFFFFLLLVALIVAQIVGSFLDPDFYTSRLDENDVYEFLLVDLPTAALEDRRTVEEALSGGDISDTPLLSSGLTTDRIVSSISRVVPPEWLQGEVERNVDAVGGYFTGRSDEFTINVQFSDRVKAAAAEAKALLAEVGANELLYDLIVEPAVVDALGGTGIQLSFGVELSSDEVVAALREAAPPGWKQEQTERLIDEVTAYVVGEEDAFEIVVSLTGAKQRAHGILTRLVETKARAAIDRLPTCRTAAEALSSFSNGIRSPACIPPSVPYDQILDTFGVDLGAEAAQYVIAPIPDTVSFLQAEFRDALQQDADDVEWLDDVRSVLRDGWIYTHEDLRDYLSETWTENEMAEFDTVRRAIDTIRTYRWLIFLPAALLLLFIGLLGGRSWPGRLMWGAAVLMVCAGVIAALFGLAYPAVASSLVADARAEALAGIDPADDYAETVRLAIDKMFDLIASVPNALASGVVTSSIVLAVIAAITLAVTASRRRIAVLIHQLQGRLNGRRTPDRSAAESPRRQPG